MWALISNQILEVGPRDWNRWVFQGWIQENLNTLISLPQLPATDDVIVVNSFTRIVPVVWDPDPVYNSRIQQLSGPALTVNTDSITGSYSVSDQPIAQVQNTMLGQLADNRYNQEVSGCTVTLQGLTLPVSTDRVTRQIWFNAIQQNIASQTWKFDNTTWLTLSLAEMQSVADAMTAHVQAAFDWEKSLHDQITSAADLATLANLNITWPDPPAPGPGAT